MDAVSIRKAMFRVCTSRAELKDWIYYFLDLELPGVIVDPESNTTPLDMAWDTYAHFTGQALNPDVSRILYYACRDGGKTLTQSVIEVLALLHLDTDVVHLSAILEQSVNASGYIKKFLNRPLFRDFVDGDSVRTTQVQLWRPVDPGGLVLTTKEHKALPPEAQLKYFSVSNKVEIIVATMQSTNGKHSGILCLDELDVVRHPAAVAESVNIPTARRLADGRIQLPLTILTSTRKSAFGLVQDEINRAHETGLVVKHFNVIDITERCFPERHLPDLPKVSLFVSDSQLKSISPEAYSKLSQKEQLEYVQEEAFAGCAKCKLHPACRTRLATHQTGDSRFLKPIQQVINTFRNNSVEMAQAQQLCKKPSSTGLIYPRLSKVKHMISPAQAYERIFGEPPEDKVNFNKEKLFAALIQHEFKWRGGIDWGSTHNFVYVVGVQVANIFYVIDAIIVAGLEPDQMLEVSAPFKKYPATVFGDPADPKMNKLFKKYGHKMVLKWNKGPGSVNGGINILRAKLNPVLGDAPELFFVIEESSNPQDTSADPYMHQGFNDLLEYHWKTGPDKKPTNVPDETRDDFPDGLRYLIMNTFDPKGVLQTESQHQAPDLPREEQKPNWLQQEIDKLVDPDFDSGDENDSKGRASSRISWDFT